MAMLSVFWIYLLHSVKELVRFSLSDIVVNSLVSD